MEISIGLAEALARFAYVQTHRAEVSETERDRAARDLAVIVREERLLASMLRAERVRRYGWHPAD
jgi:hypothetical protein